MPIFSGYSLFDSDVEKATSELNVKENPYLFKEICLKVLNTTNGSKDCLKSIMKRVNSKVPIVAIQALSLLNECVQTCGHNFRLEVASHDFVSECKSILNGGKLHKKVSKKLKSLIKKWANNEFKADPSLYLIPQLYTTLKGEGHNFTASDDDEPKVSLMSMLTKEDDDLAKAIALSLKETTASSAIKASSAPQVYPYVKPSSHSDAREVMTLYDFEAVEDNELTFKAGEVIKVLDDSDPNWWRGSSWRGEGLFPANFVTADLTTNVNQDSGRSKKSVHFQEEVEVKILECAPVLEVDEDRINETLTLIQNVDPEEEADPTELLQLEEQCKAMAPLIDQELEKIDKQHITLMEYNQKLTDAFKMYHSLMAELPLYNYPLNNQVKEQTGMNIPAPPSSFQPFLPSFNLQQQSKQQQPQQMVQDHNMPSYSVNQPTSFENGQQTQLLSQYYTSQQQIPPQQQQFKQEATQQQITNQQQIAQQQQVVQQMFSNYQQPLLPMPATQDLL